MLVTIILNFALFSYFTTDQFHYQLYGHLARCLKTHEGITPYGIGGILAAEASKLELTILNIVRGEPEVISPTGSGFYFILCAHGIIV